MPPSSPHTILPRRLAKFNPRNYGRYSPNRHGAIATAVPVATLGVQQTLLLRTSAMRLPFRLRGRSAGRRVLSRAGRIWQLQVDR